MNEFILQIMSLGMAMLRRRPISRSRRNFALPIAFKLMIGLILTWTSIARGQIQQVWVAKHNNGITNGNHQALKMTLDSIGNIYVLGVSANANTNTGYAVVKYAPNGNPLWTARYDSTNFPMASPTGFALDRSNNVVVTGTAATVQFDRNGNLSWVAPYSAQAVAIDGDGNAYIAGVSGNFITIKLSASGSNMWTSTWTYQGLPNIAQTIAVDLLTNVYVAGSETQQIPPENAEYVGLLKYDINGNQVWEDNPGKDAPYGGVQVVAIMCDSANSVYFEVNFPPTRSYETYKYNSDGSLGWSTGSLANNAVSSAAAFERDTKGNTLITGKYGYSPFTSSYGTYKLDIGGNYVWSAFYPATSSEASGATSVALDSADNVYVTGDSTNSATASDIATVKYDSNGNQGWVQRYDGPGHGNDAGNAIAVDTSGNVYVAGYETETNGFTSMILIKYSPVTVQKQSNGNFILQAFGSPGESFDIQASTNLQTWQDLGTISADTNGVLLFDDTNAPLFPNRFYYTVPQ